MASMTTIAQRAEKLLGTAVVATSPVAGGDVCTCTRVRLSDGRSAMMKTRPYAPPGFFEAEAHALRWLADGGQTNGGQTNGGQGAPVAEVYAVQDDCLIIEWIEPVRPTVEAAAEFGRALARLHDRTVDSFGLDRDGFIGVLPLPNGTAPTWPEFFATRRVLPYLKLAVDRDRIGGTDAADVDRALHGIIELAGAGEPPSALHGDLWSGNIVWSADGRGILVDPAAYAGHRETDLAMLALFGLPHLPRMMDAYAEEHPLADGWEERQPLHQLFPLLVHACMFGGTYGSRAGNAARHYL